MNDISKNSYTLQVEGMNCGHCTASVERAVRALDGVTDCAVSLENKEAVVTGGDPEAAIAAITAAGFTAKKKVTLPVFGMQPTGPADNPEPPPAGAFRINVSGMTCSACVANVEKAARAVEGVTDVRVNLVDKAAWVSGGDPDQVAAAITARGYQAGPEPTRSAADDGGYEIAVSGMSCSACVANVEKAVRAVDGVSAVSVNLVDKKAVVRGGDPGQVVAAIAGHGYQAELIEKKNLPPSP